MPNVPKRNEYVEEYKNFHCNLPKGTNQLFITIVDNTDNDYSDLLKILSKHPGMNVEIRQITSLKELNQICSLLGVFDYSGNVIVNLITRVDSCGSIKGLHNNSFINLEALPCYAKINGFITDSTQTDFTSWAHNLKRSDKHTLMGCLTGSNQRIFLEQRRVINEFYKEILKEYPNIMSFDEKKRFETVFKYIMHNFHYANVLDETGHVRIGCSYSHDAIETYNRREGVCNGRANLLALVTNNDLLRCNSAVVDGVTEPNETVNGPMPHTWNVFVDKDNNAEFYDISFREFTRRDVHNLGKRQLTKVYYSNVQEILDRPELPPRTNGNNIPPKRKAYTPLPSRRETE